MELPAPAAGHGHRDPRRGGRDRHRRPGHRADERRRGARRPRRRSGAGASRRAARPPANGAAPAAPADGDGNASPVARRVAAAARRRLARVAGSGPRRPDHEGRRARRGERRRRRAAAPAAAARRRAAAQGRRGDARPLHGREPLDPDRDLVPHAHRHVLDARRKQLKEAGQKVSFTHLIAYAIARAAHRGDAGDGAPLRASSTASRTASTTAPCNLGLAVDVEKKDGIAHADGAGDPRRRAARLRRVPRRLRRRSSTRRATNTLTADDLVGRQHLAHEPGRASARSPRCRG